MKRKLFLFITCFFLCSTMIAFFAFHTRQSGENIEKEEIAKEDQGSVKKEDNDEEINYFFNKTSGQVTMNVLLFLITGILFFLWENDKLPEEDSSFKTTYGIKIGLQKSICGLNNAVGAGIFEKANWFGFGTLVPLITTTLLVEFILNYLLIGSLAHLLSKDKNKRYFCTLRMFWEKRKRLFSSFSKKKISFVILSYLLGGFVIAILAKFVVKKIKPCCGDAIIKGHGAHYCCGYYKVESILTRVLEVNELKEDQFIDI